MSNAHLKQEPEPTKSALETGEEEPITPVSTPEENPFEQLQSDMERFRDLALRTQADFENYRKCLPAGTSYPRHRQF